MYEIKVAERMYEDVMNPPALTDTEVKAAAAAVEAALPQIATFVNSILPAEFLAAATADQKIYLVMRVLREQLNA